MKRQGRAKAAAVVGLAGLSLVALVLATYVARPAGENILLNPGFEEDDMSMWNVWGGLDRNYFEFSDSFAHRSSLPHYGIYAPHWASAEEAIGELGNYSLVWASDVEWGHRTIRQAVTIEESGYYDFSFSFFGVVPAIQYGSDHAGDFWMASARIYHSDHHHMALASVRILEFDRHDGSGPIMVDPGLHSHDRIVENFYLFSAEEPTLVTVAIRDIPLQAGDRASFHATVIVTANTEGEEFIGSWDNLTLVRTRGLGAWSRGNFVRFAVAVLMVTAGVVLAVIYWAKVKAIILMILGRSGVAGDPPDQSRLRSLSPRF